MISIVDYGLGNIQAFLNVYARLNIEARAVRTADALADATKIILPGIGAFDHAIELLDGSGMRQTLDRLVLESRVPVLGVCVGMQIMAGGSDEGDRPGLAWIDGHVCRVAGLAAPGVLQLPHMGWNDVAPTQPHRLFTGLETDARFYFLHSFYFDCTDRANVAATTNYGQDFPSAVHRDNIFGAQFHPEKSHHYGTALLRNFAEL